ncbi:MAG: glycogen/starch/alpha-glucan phosphorylase [Planctomycetota bacterium]
MDPEREPCPRTTKTVEAFRRALEDNLYYARGQAIQTATEHDAYTTLAYTVRDHLVDRWRRTVNAYHRANPKCVAYLSAEYLPGRQLSQNLLYTGTTDLAREALAGYGLDLDRLVELDEEPGLGNGGLGRLASCFLDSLATLGVPCIGYGIRYEYGIFRQRFEDGWQMECPDKWLHFGNPWEFPQPDDMVVVRFGGRTEHYTDELGRERIRWVEGETVFGEPYHTLVPGYGTDHVNVLRLWRARATREFDFQLFDAGDYARAVAEKVRSANISRVLYPNDVTPQGKELRLRQQYFFVACSLADLIRHFRVSNDDWAKLPDKVVVQLNDTHPVVAVPELMRILVDEHAVDWDLAFRITTKTFASTQHTLLPEAMESWSVGLFSRLLPRHAEIVREIDRRFRAEVATRFPGDPGRPARMAIVTDGPEPCVRMAHLACVGSFSVNGVAELQSRLLRERVLQDFSEMWPEKFGNKTNGVTPRRFVRLANPRLSALISSRIGEGWLRDLGELRDLEPLADDSGFRDEWREVKRRNKVDLAEHVRRETGIEVDPDSIFDVMVKRLHEYKRQLLKALHVITLYDRLKADPGRDIVPRTCLFGAKAAPGYRAAKLIIKLLNSLAEVVNEDADVGGRLKVVFLPNFNVSLGERIYPAADISEQISLAGMEASGTGNMKLALNGAVTTGTLDGANIEIRDRVGEENFFLFGLTTEEVFALKAAGHRPVERYEEDRELARAIDLVAEGRFSDGDRELFRPLVESLLGRDEYLLLADYRSYVDCQDAAADAYRNRESWTRMSILNAARCGYFSSDRTIKEYCEEIWEVRPVPVPMGKR